MAFNAPKTVGFFELMKKSYSFDALSARGNPKWKTLEKLFEDNYLKKIDKKSTKIIIPKKIHQIWLGGKLPDKYKVLGTSWETIHPEWEYKLWTDEDAAKFPMINRSLFDRLSNNGAKADIFRLEILNKYGGLYVDTDFECLKSFETLNKICDFFTGIGYCAEPLLANGLIACTSGHLIIRAMLKRLSRMQMAINETDVNEIMSRVGAGLLTECTFDYIDRNKENKVIAFPVSYFYPFPNNKRNITDPNYRKQFVERESLAIHYWDTSWVKQPSIWSKIKFILRKYAKKDG